MTTVELFELSRRDSHVEGQGIRHLARQRQVPRRTVRHALATAHPPRRQVPGRAPWVLTRAWRQILEGWLAADREAPPQQRHTGTRVEPRCVREHGYPGAAVTVRLYVRQQRRGLGPPAAALGPQGYRPGEAAQGDWYEAAGALSEGRRTVQFVVMRACCRGREWHLAWWRQTKPSLPGRAGRGRRLRWRALCPAAVCQPGGGGEQDTARAAPGGDRPVQRPACPVVICGGLLPTGLGRCACTRRGGGDGGPVPAASPSPGPGHGGLGGVQCLAPPGRRGGRAAAEYGPGPCGRAGLDARARGVAAVTGDAVAPGGGVALAGGQQ